MSVKRTLDTAEVLTLSHFALSPNRSTIEEGCDSLPCGSRSVTCRVPAQCWSIGVGPNLFGPLCGKNAPTAQTSSGPTTARLENWFMKGSPCTGVTAHEVPFQ